MMKRIILTLLTAVYLSVYACMSQTYMKVKALVNYTVANLTL